LISEVMDDGMKLEDDVATAVVTKPSRPDRTRPKTIGFTQQVICTTTDYPDAVNIKIEMWLSSLPDGRRHIPIEIKGIIVCWSDCPVAVKFDPASVSDAKSVSVPAESSLPFLYMAGCGRMTNTMKDDSLYDDDADVMIPVTTYYLEKPAHLKSIFNEKAVEVKDIKDDAKVSEDSWRSKCSLRILVLTNHTDADHPGWIDLRLGTVHFGTEFKYSETYRFSGAKRRAEKYSKCLLDMRSYREFLSAYYYDLPRDYFTGVAFSRVNVMKNFTTKRAASEEFKRIVRHIIRSAVPVD
jgi:hypothetical protein